MLLYNVAAKNIFIAGNGLSCMLLNNTYTHLATYTNISELTSFEVTNGAEWPVGGVDFSNLATVLDGPNDGIITADNIQVTPAAAQVGPFQHAVIYCTATGDLLGTQDYGTDKIFPVGFTSGIGIVDGHIFKITA